jgi:hypothetical protein
MNLAKQLASVALTTTLLACGGNDMGVDWNGGSPKVYREFNTSFETIEDFSDFYITPQGHLNTSFHTQSNDNLHTGNFAHKAWIEGANPASTLFINNNHRAYPTIQLHKTEGGSFQSPIMVSLWVWLDIDLTGDSLIEEKNWFSFATFTDDESDNWDRTLLVNLSHDGFVHLQHTASQGENAIIFQNESLLFPQKEWVQLKVYLDLSPTDGYAKVWQNDVLVSHAHVRNMKNRLAQAHFGMYSPPQLTSGVVYNDDLSIKMVKQEESQ